MLWAILHKAWRQHPTKQQLYGHLPPITKTIQVSLTRHVCRVGNGWMILVRRVKDMHRLRTISEPNARLCDRQQIFNYENQCVMFITGHLTVGHFWKGSINVFLAERQRTTKISRQVKTLSIGLGLRCIKQWHLFFISARLSFHVSLILRPVYIDVDTRII